MQHAIGAADDGRMVMGGWFGRAVGALGAAALACAATAAAAQAAPKAANPAPSASAAPSANARLIAAIKGPSPAPAAPHSASRMALAALAPADTLAPISISDRGGWSIPLPAIRFPAGRALSGLVVALAVGPDRDSAPAVATVALNGQLIASRMIEAGERGLIRAHVPEGLAATTNTVDISVITPERADAAGRPIRRRATLLAGSHATFAPAGAPADFRDLPAIFASGTTLVLPAAMRSDAAAGAALGRLLSGMIAPNAPLALRGGGMPAQGPVIWVGERPPPGVTAPLRIDPDPAQGSRIRDAEGATLFAAPAIAELTVAQLLDGAGRPVLWLRPGPGFARLAALPAGAELSYGDVALFDAAGGTPSRVFALHSQRERLVRIDRAGDFDLAQWLRDHRVALVLGAWLAVTALFGWLFVQTQRVRRQCAPRAAMTSPTVAAAHA